MTGERQEEIGKIYHTIWRRRTNGEGERVENEETKRLAQLTEKKKNKEGRRTRSLETHWRVQGRRNFIMTRSNFKRILERLLSTNGLQHERRNLGEGTTWKRPCRKVCSKNHREGMREKWVEGNRLSCIP